MCTKQSDTKSHRPFFPYKDNLLCIVVCVGVVVNLSNLRAPSSPPWDFTRILDSYVSVTGLGLELGLRQLHFCYCFEDFTAWSQLLSLGSEVPRHFHAWVLADSLPTDFRSCPRSLVLCYQMVSVVSCCLRRPQRSLKTLKSFEKHD